MGDNCMKPGDLLRIVRLYQGMEINTITGMLLHFHPLESFEDIPEKCYNICMLETNGSISEFILDSRDEIEVIHEAG